MTHLVRVLLWSGLASLEPTTSPTRTAGTGARLGPATFAVSAAPEDARAGAAGAALRRHREGRKVLGSWRAGQRQEDEGASAVGLRRGVRCGRRRFEVGGDWSQKAERNWKLQEVKSEESRRGTASQSISSLRRS